LATFDFQATFDFSNFPDFGDFYDFWRLSHSHRVRGSLFLVVLSFPVPLITPRVILCAVILSRFWWREWRKFRLYGVFLIKWYKNTTKHKRALKRKILPL
jgi:hypothetical protein